MLFSVILTITMLSGGIQDTPTQVLSIKQNGLSGDRCSTEQILLENECVEIPKLLKKPAPKYPGNAQRALVEGTVGLKAVLQPDGTIGEIQVTSGFSNPKFGFEDAVIKALEKWRYQPVLLHGKPVSVPFEVRVEFKFSSR
jgi:TonB family protein